MSEVGDYLHNKVKKYRPKALDMKGEYCHICGSVDDIEVHHINARREDRVLSKESNHHIRNLLPVCSRCHNSIHSGDKGMWSEYAKNGKAPGEIKKEHAPHVDHEYDTKTELAVSVKAHDAGKKERMDSLGPCPECGDGRLRSLVHTVNHSHTLIAHLKCEECGFEVERRLSLKKEVDDE